MAKKINIVSSIRFTFLVWVKSVAFILGFTYLFALSVDEQLFGESFPEFLHIVSISYLYTSPFFLMMLAVVYNINHTEWTITSQKIIIAIIYVVPIFIIYICSLQYFTAHEGFLLITSFFCALIVIPALMIYFTKLSPADNQLTSEEKRADIIDDISFDE